MVVRMAHFPQDLAVPVRLQDHATFERKATEKALLRRAPVVEECSPLGEIAGQAWRVRHVPGVDDIAAEVDEIDPSVPPDEGRKEGKARKGALRVESAQANSAPFDRDLLHRWRFLPGHRVALHTSSSDSRGAGA